jgi:hypothetical protein
MNQYSIFAQAIVAISIVYVWTFRFHNVEKEFNQFGLSNFIRSSVGASKIALATLLFAGIWYSELVLIPSLLIAFLMTSAQYFHIKMGNPWIQRLPSLILLLLCLFIAAVNLELI